MLPAMPSRSMTNEVGVTDGAFVVHAGGGDPPRRECPPARVVLVCDILPPVPRTREWDLGRESAPWGVSVILTELGPSHFDALQGRSTLRGDMPCRQR